jgi:hypothetical protein
MTRSPAQRLRRAREAQRTLAYQLRVGEAWFAEISSGTEEQRDEARDALGSVRASVHVAYRLVLSLEKP